MTDTPPVKKAKKEFPPHRIVDTFMNCSKKPTGAITFSYEFDNTDEMINQAIELLKTKLGDKGLFLTEQELDDDEVMKKHFLTSSGQFNYDSPIQVIVCTTPRLAVEEHDSSQCLASYFSGCTIGVKRLDREENEIVEQDQDGIYAGAKYQEPGKDETMEQQISRIVEDLITPGLYIAGVRIGEEKKEEKE
jgi:hypothetical protein